MFCIWILTWKVVSWDDLSDAIASSDIKDNFAETLVNNYVRDGKNYAVPKDFDTNALWYNKDLFDQAGVEYPTDDMTYDDLVALATELKDKLPDGVYPFACPLTSRHGIIRLYTQTAAGS